MITFLFLKYRGCNGCKDLLDVNEATPLFGLFHPYLTTKIYIAEFVCMYVRACVHVCACMYVRACMCVHVCACMCACMCVHVCMCASGVHVLKFFKSVKSILFCHSKS